MSNGHNKDTQIQAKARLHFLVENTGQISGRLCLEGLKMVGKSTLYKWLHQDNRADMRFYLDMVKHSLDYLKGEKVGSQACFLVLTYTYYRVVRCLKSGSLTTTKKSRNKDYFNKELLFY